MTIDQKPFTLANGEYVFAYLGHIERGQRSKVKQQVKLGEELSKSIRILHCICNNSNVRKIVIVLLKIFAIFPRSILCKFSLIQMSFSKMAVDFKMAATITTEIRQGFT